MTMKENQNPTIYDSNYRNEEDPLPVGVKEIYQLDDPQKGTDTIEFDINDRDVHCNSKILISCSNDNEIGRSHSPTDEIPCSLSQFRGPGVSLSSETKDREKFLTSAALESSIVEEYRCCEESEFKNSGAKPVAKADLIGRHTHSYTDKNALECQLPELIVCDKKVNDQSVKDICIDYGMPANDKNLTRSCEDDHSGGGKADSEFIISNILVLSLENIDSSQSMSNPLPYNSFDENTADKCDPEGSTLTDEVICNATKDTLTDSSEEESIADKKLPIQDFGELNPLRFFSEPLDGEGDKTVQSLDQLQSSSGNEDSESPVPLSVEVEQREENQPENENISCDSKLERGSTSDFNYSAPIQTCIITDNVKEQSEETGVVDAYAHDKNADDISDPGTRNSRTEVIEKQAVEHKPENSENSPNASQVHCIGGNSENSPNTSQFQTPVSTDDQLVEQRAMKHDRKDSNDVSVYNKQLQHGEEESSFSSAALLTYSGPVAYSGSLSLRSDGSATSGKSFAFPLLQSEWNSSPVRMTKADRRHYRKEKDWRSSILCCRF